MSRVDLERIEEMVQTYAPNGWVRTYVPALVVEVRELRAFEKDATYQVEQLQQQRNEWVVRANEYARQRDDAYEEIAQLKAEATDDR